jgi:hypothetical protein
MVGLPNRVINPSQGRYLYRTTQKQKKQDQISMPRVGLEPTINMDVRMPVSVFEYGIFSEI